jgi:hypothetical protein
MCDSEPCGEGIILLPPHYDELGGGFGPDAGWRMGEGYNIDKLYKTCVGYSLIGAGHPIILL